jgi:uncharacterized protein (TIGR02118 family)
MVRFTVIWRVPPDAVEEFDRHYREVHIPLTKEMSALRSYRVSRDVTAVRGDPAHLLAELEWDDMPALRRDFESAEGKALAVDLEKLASLGAEPRGLIYELEDA